MTKHKRLLLICGIIFTPFLSLIALILRAAALFTELDAARGYFQSRSPLHTAYLWVVAISILLFFMLAILCRKEFPAPSLRGSLSVLFAGAFFLVTMAVAAISGFLSVPAAPAGLTKLFCVISAIGALISLVYFGLFFRRDEAQGMRHALLGLAPAFFALFTAILLYFDRTTHMNEPPKLLHLSAFLLLACFFIGEARALLGQPCRPLYYFTTATALLLCATASVPNLLYNLLRGQVLVLTTVYDFVLLAGALYLLARLLQILPYELPAVHQMVQHFLNTAAETAGEEAEESESGEPLEALPAEEEAPAQENE